MALFPNHWLVIICSLSPTLCHIICSVPPPYAPSACKVASILTCSSSFVRMCRHTTHLHWLWKPLSGLPSVFFCHRSAHCWLPLTANAFLTPSLVLPNKAFFSHVPCVCLLLISSHVLCDFSLLAFLRWKWHFPSANLMRAVICKYRFTISAQNNSSLPDFYEIRFSVIFFEITGISHFPR